MIMKVKFSLVFCLGFALLLVAGMDCMAQEYCEYLETAVRFIDEGNCDRAEMNYNVYKKLSGKSFDFIEQKISECKDTLGASSGLLQVQLNFNDYEALPSDLDGLYTWEEANTACENLTAFGRTDWILPDKSELAGLCKNKDKIGLSSSNEGYWSSSEYNTGSSNAWYLRSDNVIENLSKGWRKNVRCVRKVNGK